MPLSANCTFEWAEEWSEEDSHRFIVTTAHWKLPEALSNSIKGKKSPWKRHRCELQQSHTFAVVRTAPTVKHEWAMWAWHYHNNTTFSLRGWINVPSHMSLQHYMDAIPLSDPISVRTNQSSPNHHLLLHLSQSRAQWCRQDQVDP